MAIQFYQPTRPFDAFNDAFNRTFRGASGEPRAADAAAFRPAVDIRETEAAYLIEVEVAGVDPNSIDVTLDKGVLKLNGERVQASDEDAGEIRRSERSYGTFERRFSLPDTADVDTIEARAAHGILYLTIAKKAQSQPRRITVQQAD
ncbi:Hsp20/alpha crystallin family protein [Salinisphaera aquimarina]|uniref:Hsp20/alpha crystallin family protein n=1 Tax=Salinisphaera aquimarina TaxID=2094031 RepID=A0ABV7EKP3_9GAMM